MTTKTLNRLNIAIALGTGLASLGLCVLALTVAPGCWFGACLCGLSSAVCWQFCD